MNLLSDHGLFGLVVILTLTADPKPQTPNPDSFNDPKNPTFLKPVGQVTDLPSHPGAARTR